MFVDRELLIYWSTESQKVLLVFGLVITGLTDDGNPERSSLELYWNKSLSSLARNVGRGSYDWKQRHEMCLIFRSFMRWKTLGIFGGLDWINSGLIDPDDVSDESWIDADDATIWERGERTRRCANSFS